MRSCLSHDIAKRLACCVSPLNGVNLRICTCACMRDLVCHTDFTERHVLYVTPERCESADVCVCVSGQGGGEVGERATERDRQKTSRTVCHARSRTRTRTRTRTLTRTCTCTRTRTCTLSHGPLLRELKRSTNQYQHTFTHT